MQVLRTPESRFARLPDFPYEPRYVPVGDELRMHYIDEGPPSGPPVVLLHGEPTWSFLYRKMIPPLVAAGFRVVVPDLIGFGRSDKPTEFLDYSYEKHQEWLLACLDSLRLEGSILFCQDWGSLLGLRIAGEQPDRFSRIMVANGFLPTAERPMPFAFKAWRAFAQYSPWFPISRIVRSGTVHGLDAAVAAAYDAPFPDSRYMAGARAFPSLVPTRPSDPATPRNRKAWEGLARFERPFLCVFGRDDPILGKGDRPLIAHVPGATGQPHGRIRGGHFIQEDQGEELARRLIEWARPS